MIGAGLHFTDLNNMFSIHNLSILRDENIPLEYANNTILSNTDGKTAFRPVVSLHIFIENCCINFYHCRTDNTKYTQMCL